MEIEKSGLIAVTISSGSEGWSRIGNIPLFTSTEGDDPRYRSRAGQKSNSARMKHLANRRNIANKKALESYPETEHIMAVDSFYLHQTIALERLVTAYLSWREECIMGAPTWALHKATLKPKLAFYDTWSTPEMENYTIPPFVMPSGIVRVSSVGACYIYPRWVWDRYQYQIPEPFPDAGIYHNWLCQKSGLPVFINFDAKLWRTHADNPDIPSYSIPHRALITLRMSLPYFPSLRLGRLLRKWERPSSDS